MKYIKTFEDNKNIDYNVDDYILIKKYYIDFWKSKWAIEKQDVFKFAKIIGNYEIRYAIEVISNNTIKKFYLPDKYFERKLNEEEIEEFEIKKASLKFNL